MSISVTGIYRYPVKSCRGVRLTEAVVEPWGLAGDRRWMIVDANGTMVTARTHPQLVLVTVAADNSNTDNSNKPRPGSNADNSKNVLRFEAPDMPTLSVPVPVPVPYGDPAPSGDPALSGDPNPNPNPAPSATAADAAGLMPVTVQKSRVLATPASDDAAVWLTKIVGEPVRLVYLDDPTRRPVNVKYGRDTDRVSFADGYPLLLTSEASLAQLNDWIAEGPYAPEAPVPMMRFRPSVVVAGSLPWEEDGWRRIRIGGVSFRVAKGCDRCVFTTIDPATAAKGREPLATLAQRRRWDGKVWFGVNLIPDLPNPSDTPDIPALAPGAPAVIGTGDPVELL